MSKPSGFIQKYIFSQDHKVIGLQYIGVGLGMLVIGVFLSYVVRMNLAFPGESIPLFGDLVAKKYNELITIHGTIMVFWVAMPVLVAGFGNLLIPLMVGHDDMAFPFLNLLSFWIFFLSTVVLLTSFFVPGGAFDGGWTAYPPLSANAYRPQSFLNGLGGHLWILAVALEFVAFLMGGINFIVTIINRRCLGMTWYRLPIIVWMFLMAVLIFMFSVGPLIAGAVMLLLDRVAGTGFYNPAMGGDPVLFQHLFWFFGHPEVYVLFLPALGIIAEIISTQSRKPLFGYRTIIHATMFASLISFIVWAHHQFISGIDPRMATFFSITTIIISIPFAINIFAFIATLFRGSIRFTPAMLFAVGFISTFLVGGITGIYLGSSAFDIHAHDTYFVVAHFHYTLIPTVIFASFAGLYHWFPKFIGRHLNDRLGKIHFWGTVVPFNSIFLPLFLTG
ncbi:MAG: cytochrome c oxidase subunit 1, partial [Candidatus Marinamargulisbacteria bacterium]